MEKLEQLKPGIHIHLMGICGTAMASLAGLLKDRGFKVTGSDSSPYPPMSTQLENLKIPVMKGYSAKNLNPKPDFVIVGNVISANNEEAQEMVKLKIPHTSLPKAMGEFIIEHRESIVVAGTHGKTTTTSLMSWVTTQLGLKPGFLIGGIAKDFNKSFQNPEGNYFVIEGDEYDTAYFDKVPKFIHYKPKHVILTSIEFDHADIYKDLDAVKQAFTMLMKLIPINGTLLYHGHDKNIADILPDCGAQKVKSYGMGLGDYQAKIKSIGPEGTAFDVWTEGKILVSVKMQLGGDYNILNATAVVGLAHQLGWDLGTVVKAIASFSGVKRRQEILGEPKGILVIEDFAHHPTAVKETLKGIQERYKGRKVFAVFEPRSATSRRKVFQKDYAEAFKYCDEALLAKAFDQTKIDSENRFSSEELVQDLQKQGKIAHVFDGADQIVQSLRQSAKKNDLIVIMSNGGFDGIYGKLMKALE